MEYKKEFHQKRNRIMVRTTKTKVKADKNKKAQKRHLKRVQIK